MERVGIHRGLIVIAGLHRGRLWECRRALPGKLCYFLALSRSFLARTPNCRRIHRKKSKEGPRLSPPPDPQLFLGELSSRPRRARGSPRISHSPRSLIPITSRCLIDCMRRLVPPSAEVARVTTRRPPRTPRPLAPRPPRPSSLPPWPKRTTTRSGTASPTSESRCGAWEAWRCVPRFGPVGFSRNPRASGSIARRREGASSPASLRARSSPHGASSLSARYADRLLRRRHHLPRQEGEGREGGQEVTGPDVNGQPARRAAKRRTPRAATRRARD